MGGTSPPTRRCGSPSSWPTTSTSCTLFVGSGDDQIYAIDTTTGAAQWSYAADGAVHWRSSPIVSPDSVFVCSDDGKIHAIDTITGLARWTYKAGDVAFSPTVSPDSLTVFVSSRKPSSNSWTLGKLHAIDAAT